MAKGDLTTLANVKAWLGIKTEDAATDKLLAQMISAASRFVLGYLGRPGLAAADIEEVYDGYGNNFMSLRQWPVISLASIGFFGINIDKPSTGNPRSPGFILGSEDLGPSRVTLWGHSFPRARSAVTVSYRAGYVTEECVNVPSAPFQVTPENMWLADEGVTHEGVALVRVKEDPETGEYSVSNEGVYTFAAADDGNEVCIRYSYVPADIQQAVYELVGEQFKYKDRIGIKSKSLGGGVSETVSYTDTDMSPYLATLLQPYKRVVPV